MFKVTKDLRKIAKKVMDNALPIQRGEVAVFYAGIENLDLAYAFAAECELRGIETLVQSCGDYINHIKLLEAPIQVFEKLPKLPFKLVEAADWFISARAAWAADHKRHGDRRRDKIDLSERFRFEAESRWTRLGQ